jgi:Wzt C-terminal domain
MSIVFQDVHAPPLDTIRATAPAGSIIGIFGDDVAAQSMLLRVGAGLAPAVSGKVEATGAVRWIGPFDALNLAPVDNLLLEHSLALQPNLVRASAARDLERLRRAGSTILLASHDEPLLRMLCDEIWWIEGGRLAGKGEPGEAFQYYHRHLAAKIRMAADGQPVPLHPALRRGNGKAVVESIELLGSSGRSTGILHGGEYASVRIRVRYVDPAEDPVVGIMIRTRIGFEVYGTNTEMEKLKLGPVKAGETLEVKFQFKVDLCPTEFTLTAASHDPDGVWHDWLEDALAFSVTDARFTAGVANLRAKASVTRVS